MPQQQTDWFRENGIRTVPRPRPDPVISRGADDRVSEVTRLSPPDESRFKKWVRDTNITDVDHPDSFYDYRGYWKDVARTGGDQRQMYDDGPHFPDTYKQHGHPTFSVESKYSTGPDDGGRWDGDAFVPAVAAKSAVEPDWFGANGIEAIPFAATPDFRTSNEMDAEGQPVVAAEELEPGRHGAARLAEVAGDVGIGALKGVGSSVVGAAELMRTLPVVGHALEALNESVMGLSPEAQDYAFAEIRRMLEPANTAQRIGKFGEQIAEVIVPGRAITAAATKASTALAPHLSKVMGKTAGALAPRVAVEAAGGAGIAAIQGGDLPTAAALSGAMPVAGKVVSAARRALQPGTKLNAVEEAAVQFGKDRDIPLDAATATGRPIIQTAQKWAGDLPGGAATAERFKDTQIDALKRVGNDLMEGANQGGAAFDRVAAGERVRGAILARRNEQADAADKAYNTLRQLEAASPAQSLPTGATKATTKATATGAVDAAGNPIVQTAGASAPVTESMRMAVDLRQAKAALKPIYDELMERYPVAQQQASPGLKALQNIIEGPDFGPLSRVDANLGAIKALSRVADGELRSVSQGLAATAVKDLDDAVRATASKAGPQAIKALLDGRAATIAKYQVDDALQLLSNEPAQVFGALTRNKDAGLERLRAVHKYAPAEVPAVARAYMEELIGRATREGGFDAAKTLHTQWSNLGNETKKILFPDSAGQIDRFLLLAKRISENPNPSGTARVRSVMDAMKFAPAWAVAKLMYTPSGVAMLSRSAQTGQAGEIKKALGRIVATQTAKVVQP